MTATPNNASLPKESFRTAAIKLGKAFGTTTVKVGAAVGISVVVAVISGTILQKIADGKAQANTPVS